MRRDRGAGWRGPHLFLQKSRRFEVKKHTVHGHFNMGKDWCDILDKTGVLIFIAAVTEKNKIEQNKCEKPDRQMESGIAFHEDIRCC